MSVNYGSKRIDTGAHYGLRDWLAQRVTGALMALFTLVLLAQVIFTSGPIGYEQGECVVIAACHVLRCDADGWQHRAACGVERIIKCHGLCAGATGNGGSALISATLEGGLISR